jgi:hypothetical protein
MNTWTMHVEEDEYGNLVLPLNQDILDLTKWKEGDIIEWVDNKDGSWTLKKKEETEWVLVETVQQFRHRYMVEVPVGKKDWALDTVTLDEAKEFSQLHLGETIVSHRVVTEEEALRICDEDNDYCKTWNDEHKINVFFTKEGEKRED